MHRAYALVAALMVGVFGYAQFNHWSLYGSAPWCPHPSRLSSTGTRGK